MWLCLLFLLRDVARHYLVWNSEESEQQEHHHHIMSDMGNASAKSELEEYNEDLLHELHGWRFDSRSGNSHWRSAELHLERSLH